MNLKIDIYVSCSSILRWSRFVAIERDARFPAHWFDIEFNLRRDITYIIIVIAGQLTILID